MNKVLTLIDYIGEHRLKFLNQVDKDFVQTNLSGDITSFSDAHKKYIDRMIKEVDEKFKGGPNA